MVHDTYRLALGPGDLAEGEPPDLRGDPEEVLELAPEPLFRGRLAPGLRLHAQHHPLAAPRVLLEHDLVLVAEARLAQQRPLDLTRIEVDALDDHHVVGPPPEAVQPDAGPPAGAA